MTPDPSDPGEDDAPLYVFRPSLAGAPRQFMLTEGGIAWIAGRHSGTVPFTAVRRVRLSFRPVNMQTQRYVTEIWAEGGSKLEIVSSSWKSMFAQERLDQSYTAFVGELHRRIARAAAAVTWEQGINPFRYWPGIAVFAAVAFGLSVLIVRALQAQAYGGAGFIAAFAAVFFWQGGDFLRRNRPRRYRPEALPAEVMPKDG